MIRWLTDFYQDEEGQATTEYFLMLSIVVSLTLMVITKFIRPVFERFGNQLSALIEKRLFGADLHTFRVGPVR
jgi:Flp pilus assembly pilin Flp